MVLATAGADGPHTSLMAYVAQEDGHSVFMVMAAGSRKWENICAEPRVSLMVDSRTDVGPHQKDSIEALTVSGVASSVPAGDDAFRRIREMLLGKHPQLEQFVNDEQGRIIRVDATQFLLLSGVSDAFRIEL